MTLTSEQISRFNDYVGQVRSMLQRLELPTLTTNDSEDANRIIADSRSALNNINLSLFGGFHLLADFYRETKPKSIPQPKFTVDDL